MQQEQNTIKVTLGIISYLRNLFSEESFRNEKVEGMNLKVLTSTSETMKMIEWIKNLSECEESIHKIQLGIYNKNNNDNRLMELYSINLKDKINYRSFCKILQKMESLKGKITVKLKVFTTAFVEIGGFKKSNETWNLEGMKEKEIEGMKIYRFDDNKGDDGKNENNNDVNDDENTTILTSNPTHNNINIKCSCMINNNESNMILCNKCQSWVHLTCHGYFSSKDRRIGKSFQCFQCSNSLINKEIRDCCIYRRILNFIYNEEEVFLNRTEVVNFIIKRLGTSVTFTNSLVTKLIQDGFIKKNQNRIEVVKSKEIKEKIKEYFNGKRMECFVSMEEIEIEAGIDEYK